MQYIKFEGNIQDRANIEHLGAKVAQQEEIINNLLGVGEDGQSNESETTKPGNADVPAESEA